MRSKSLRQSIINTCEPLLNSNNFFGTNLLYYRKSDDYLEIIEIGRDKYEPVYRVWASIVYLKKDKGSNNIHYDAFKYINNDLSKITPFECKERYFLKGDRRGDFYFNDVYLAFGLGFICANLTGKKPFGFRIKKRTVEEGCNKLLSELPKVFEWLKNMKSK